MKLFNFWQTVDIIIVELHLLLSINYLIRLCPLFTCRFDDRDESEDDSGEDESQEEEDSDESLDGEVEDEEDSVKSDGENEQGEVEGIKQYYMRFSIFNLILPCNIEHTICIFNLSLPSIEFPFYLFNQIGLSTWNLTPPLWL